MDAVYSTTQYIANTREMMDAANSARWTDAFITTILGTIHAREWSTLLSANPYVTFAQVSVTTGSTGQFAFSALTTGSGDTKQIAYKMLALTDGASTIYRETSFIAVPLATSTQYASPYARLYYMAGDNVQVLPVTSGLGLVCTVNWTPVPMDQLSTASIKVSFPSGHEKILWLEAAAELLSKGGAETDAAATMRQIASVERTQMFQDFVRRAARPQFMQYPDSASEWAGGSGGGF